MIKERYIKASSACFIHRVEGDDFITEISVHSYGSDITHWVKNIHMGRIKSIDYMGMIAFREDDDEPTETACTCTFNHIVRVRSLGYDLFGGQGGSG